MEQQQNPPEQVPAPKQPIVIHKSNNVPLIGAIIFLALVIAAAAIYLGSQKAPEDNKTTNNAVTPSPQISEIISPTLPPSVDTSNWEVANIPKQENLSFPSYTIKHPSEWIAKEVKDGISHTLTLTKGENEIKIYQAPTDGAQCIFEGELPEGPSSDYRNSQFTDIKLSSTTIRRVSIDSGFAFCSSSNTPLSFGSPTSFGAISYKTVSNPPASLLSEMDSILQTLVAK